MRQDRVALQGPGEIKSHASRCARVTNFGVPLCNQFLKQESGTSEEILAARGAAALMGPVCTSMKKLK